MKTTRTSYPMRLDDNVIRSVASLTFFLSILMVFVPRARFLVIPMAIDFLLRWINPKFSPIARMNKWINLSLFKNVPKPVFSPPKRFAMLIGLIITTSMSMMYILELPLFFEIFLASMILASGLQSWFDFCLGCVMYDFLVQRGLAGRGKTIDDFSSYLSSLGDSNQAATLAIENQLKLEAMKDGRITIEESVLLDQIISDLHKYDELLNEAISDGVISYEEKRVLWHDRDQIVRKAYDIANSDGKISPDEERLLSLLHDLMLEKSAVISGN